MDTSVPPQMEPHGLQGLLERQMFFMESPMATVPLWQWGIQEPSSPLQMEPHGRQGLLG